MKKDDVYIYDREGKPITLRRHRQFLKDRNYIIVQQDFVKSLDDVYVFVSTVWTGLDFSGGFSDKPLIFQTKCFHVDMDGKVLKSSEKDNQDLPFDYYYDEYEAVNGHFYISEWIKSNSIEEDIL